MPLGTRSPRRNLPVLDGIDTAGRLGGDATVNDVISAIPVAPGDNGYRVYVW